MTKETIYQRESSWAPCRRWEMTRKWKLWQHVHTDLLSARARYNEKHPNKWRKEIIPFACWSWWLTWWVDDGLHRGVWCISNNGFSPLTAAFTGSQVTGVWSGNDTFVADFDWIQSIFGISNPFTLHSYAVAALHNKSWRRKVGRRGAEKESDGAWFNTNVSFFSLFFVVFKVCIIIITFII